MNRHSHLLLNLIAQTNPMADIGSKVAGILVGAVSALVALGASAATVYALWSLLKALLKDPSPEKLAGIVATALFAAFLIGATPAMVSSAFTYGQSFFAG